MTRMLIRGHGECFALGRQPFNMLDAMLFTQPLIAIDIGSTSVKIVELSGGAERKLQAAGLEPCPPGAFADGQIKNEEPITEVVKGLLKTLKIRPFLRRAVIGLGGNSLIIKKIKVPKGPDADMIQQISYEAEQQFQGDLTNLYWDHSRLDNEPDANGNLSIVLVAAHREMVERRLSIIRAAGLRGGVVECDVFAATNMFEYNYGVTNELLGVINVGATGTSLALIAGGRYLFNREIGIGGEEYTRRLMEALKLDRDNAESLKIGVSQGEGKCPAEAQRIINDANEQLANEIQMSFSFFFQTGEAPNGITRPSHIFLHGGGCRVLGLDAAMAAAMHVPVHIINPFQRVNVNPKKLSLDYVVSHGHLYGTAVGMAMRQIHDNR